MSGAVRVRLFPGAQHLALYVARARGIFGRHGLAVEIDATPDSDTLRAGLAAGRFDVAHAAADNAVALAEATGADVVVVLGGDGGLTRLVARREVAAIADLRGRTVLVDAPHTAYALQVRALLRRHGLEAGRDYALRPFGGTYRRLEAMRSDPALAATMLYPPYSILAEREGFHSLGLATAALGPYQATAAFVRREWARAEGDTLERYIMAVVEALRWALDPVHRDAAVAVLAEALGIPGELAARCYDELADPAVGLAPDGRLDLDGFRTVLALRAELEGQWGGQPPPPERYYDPTWYDRALARLGGR